MALPLLLRWARPLSAASSWAAAAAFLSLQLGSGLGGRWDLEGLGTGGGLARGGGGCRCVRSALLRLLAPPRLPSPTLLLLPPAPASGTRRRPAVFCVLTAAAAVVAEAATAAAAACCLGLLGRLRCLLDLTFGWASGL